MRRVRALFALALVAVALSSGASCHFDPAYRDIALPLDRVCDAGDRTCRGAQLLRCADDELTWILEDDCGPSGKVCAPTLLRCTSCLPTTARCDGQTVLTCNADGVGESPTDTCDPSQGFACRQGTCAHLCGLAESESSNVGCEYWAVDLDNAVPDASRNAAAQTFAVVVSNVQPDVFAQVTLDVDDAAPGEPQRLRSLGTASVAPGHLEVFQLPAREVDGSADGTFNTGTGTALTRHAFRVRSHVPIVAYQFNPLENADVFSNDASQLLPVSALGGSDDHDYVIASWPQTIATSPRAEQNFGVDLRSFVTIVGTRANTKVTIRPSIDVIPGGPFPQGLVKDKDVEVTLQPFEVLNLESGGFMADFTGTFVDASSPVAVFAGSEASDAPLFASLDQRFCCADHLEEQGIPTRAAGRRFVAARMPNRSRAVAAAGARLAAIDEPEIFRVVATRPGNTHVTTNLPAPDNSFDLTRDGDERTLTVRGDFTLEASNGVIVADVQVGQDAAGVRGRLPGGDPSLTYLPPIEQYKSEYVLLTPDKYAFDYLVVTAPKEARAFIDGRLLDRSSCEVGDVGPSYVAYRCQLSFPAIDVTKDPAVVLPGRQNDGVHRVTADLPVGVVVYGFDTYVSYAYPGGTALREINVR
jgi:hypothetical protein